MHLVFKLFVGLALVAVLDPIFVQNECVTKTPVTEEIVNPDFVIDFDGLVRDESNDFTTVNKSGPIRVLLSGDPRCIISNYINLGGSEWKGGELWNGENTTPGDFVMINGTQDIVCSLSFIPSVTYLSMRVAGYKNISTATWIGIRASTSEDEELCSLPIEYPTDQNGADTINGYSVVGFSSTRANIWELSFALGYLAIDQIKGIRCPQGNTLIDDKCTTPCQLTPCGSNTNCTNFANGTRQCTCYEYYEGDPIVGCEKWSCATQSSQCSSDATCVELTTAPYFNCTCNSGFTGSGYGPNGCVAVPMSPAPVKKVNASSLMTPLLWLTWCSWILM